MARNKVIYGGEVLIDITSTTAVEADVAAGKTFFKADGTPATGTASGGGGTYVRTVIAPQQTVTPDNSRQADPVHTGGFVDGEYYVITLDGVEWITTCETLWTDNLTTGDCRWFFGTTSDAQYPFGAISYQGDLTVAFADTNQHTIKIEHLEFVADGIDLTTKTITQNGTYSATDDNADGYSSVSVAIPFVTYYTGSSAPSASLGNNGDIYLQS